MAKRFGRTKVLNVKAKAKAKSLKDFTQFVKFNKDLVVEKLRTLKTLHSELRTLKPGKVPHATTLRRGGYLSH